VVRNNAFIASSRGLYVVNVKDFDEPILVGKSSWVKNARSISVKENRAYIAAGHDGLVVVDVSNPYSPYIIDSLRFPGFYYKVKIVADYVHVVNVNGDIKTIDISSFVGPGEVK